MVRLLNRILSCRGRLKQQPNLSGALSTEMRTRVRARWLHVPGFVMPNNALLLAHLMFPIQVGIYEYHDSTDAQIHEPGCKRRTKKSSISFLHYILLMANCVLPHSLHRRVGYQHHQSHSFLTSSTSTPRPLSDRISPLSNPSPMLLLKK